jgi:hypothetical protein
MKPTRHRLQQARRRKRWPKRLKPQHERRLRLPKPPSPRRTRSPPQLETTRAPTTTPRPLNVFFSFSFKLLTRQSFFNDIPHTLQTRRDPQDGRTRLHATQAEEARGRRIPASCCRSSPDGGAGEATREDPSGSRGRSCWGGSRT